MKKLNLTENVNVTLMIKADDLQQVIDNAINKALEASREMEKESLPKYVHGLQGIADLFNVSRITAQKWKNTWLSDAVMQQGRTLLTDTEKALQLFSKRNEG